MHKYLFALFIGLFVAMPGYAVNNLATDTSDPLFLQSRGGVLSKTGLDYFETGLRLGQSLSVGLVDRLVIGGNVHYQRDFNGDEDGFSSIDLGGVYRMGTTDENKHSIIYDVLAGLKFGGSKHVRSPEFADSTYYIGFRLGRQYSGVTFAGTIKSSWIFDEERGMAFIDLIPEMYVRIADAWRFGANFALRKATNPDFDEESIGAKLVREYGRTQYIGHMDYAFESEDISAGVSINILF